MTTPAYDETSLRVFGAKIGRLLAGQSLTREETRDAFADLLLGAQPDLQQGAFLAALHGKGATPAELAGVWQAFMDVEILTATPQTPEPCIDVCGTGADSLKTVNVSTGAAIIAAAAGVYVSKKGAPAITGKAGTSDTFEALGLETMVPLERVVQSVERVGLGFAHAFMGGKGALGRVLSQIRFPSSINIVGPLTTPLNARRQVFGVFTPALTELAANVALECGFDRMLVPCGGSDERPGDYLDEYSNIGPTIVAELRDGTVRTYTVTPAELGLKTYRYEDIATGPDAAANARMIVEVLTGRDRGAKRDLLCLNAAACIYLAGKVETLQQGLALAFAAVDDGRAIAKLKDLIGAQNSEPAAGLAKLEGLIAGDPVARV